MNPEKKKTQRSGSREKSLFYDNIIFMMEINVYLFMLQSGIFRINRTGVGNLSETVALPYLLGMVL